MGCKAVKTICQNLSQPSSKISIDGGAHSGYFFIDECHIVSVDNEKCYDLQN